MFEWLLKQMMNLAIGAAGWFIDKILSALNFDLTYFSSQFTIVADSYKLFQTMGLGLVMLFLIWQCVKTFGAPIGIEGDDPVKVFFKSILAVYCIYHAQEIFNLGFEFFKPIFDTLNSAPFTYAFQMGGPFNGYNIASGIVDASTMIAGLSGLPFAVLCVYAIILVVILFNLLKMVIEITERYILMGILAVTAPLGFSTMTNKGTANIFAAWSRMVMGQFVIYLLNIWILKMFLNAFSKSTPGLGQTEGIIWLIFMWAFLRVAQKLDQFLGKLGIEVGNAGGSLMEELMVSKMAMGAIGGGKGGAAGILGGLTGKGGGGGGLAAAMTGALAGGAAVKGSSFLGGILNNTAFRAVRGVQNAGGLGNLASNAMGGFASTIKDVGNTFQNAKDSHSSSKLGKFGGVMAGAAAVAANPLKKAIGLDHHAGASLAGKINRSNSSGGILNDKEMTKLKNPDVASNTLGHLNHAVEGNEAREMLTTLMNGQNLGELTPDKMKDPSFDCKAYNGGVSWAYTDSASGKAYKGVVAVNGNNDASKHIANMRKAPGASFGEVKQAGGRKVSYAYNSVVKPPKPENPNPIGGGKGKK